MISSVQAGAVAAAYSYSYGGQSKGNAPNTTTATPTDDSGFVTINVSKGGLLASDALLPTRANLQASSAALAQSLNAFLAQQGFGLSPPISVSTDPNSLQVTVTGDRPDAQKIADAINNDPALQRQIHNTAALGSRVSAFAQALQFENQWFAADSQSDDDALISKYSALLSGKQQPAQISLTFNGTSVGVDADGKPL